MRISAAGNRALLARCASTKPRGFSLIELLVVVSIIAIGSAGVVFALRDSAQTQIEREAQRLAALLEAGRAQSRTHGIPVVWRANAQGFQFDGLPSGTLPDNWLDAGTSVASGSQLALGPDPIVAAQSVTLFSKVQSGVGWRVATDGLRPFRVEIANPVPAGSTAVSTTARAASSVP